VDPYFHIAEQYGFANWMFQTHQGPSQPAHLFLFSGTSAPDFYNDKNSNCGSTDPDCWHWFAAENPIAADAGCTSPPGTVVWDLPPATTQTQNPTEQKAYTPKTPPFATAGYPCYNHPTLVDLFGSSISWRYYTGGNQSFGIWRAPDLIQNICQPTSTYPNTCTYAGYTNNVYTGNPAQVLRDLGGGSPEEGCNLQQVSWVVPDGDWSDHPGAGSFDGGPSWVAAIVNAVGNYTNFGQQLRATPCADTINGQQVPYWQDTVVLVLWDDWGGFYDDILPWNCDATGFCGGYPNTTAREYVYGFRVPLLVVSPYVKLTNGQPGYISGACPGGNCQNQEKPPYVHDFGSILNFIEYAFGTGGNPLGGTGGISPSYFYADWLAPDGPNNPALCSPQQCPYGLFDFFNFGQTPRPFSRILGAKYDTGSFLNPGAYFPNYPADPDDDAINDD
jgi:hypothetical protein